MSTQKNNFRFFIPIDEITKAKNKDGVEVMKLGGIASTKRRDTDGEILSPGGMDLSYLQERGIINWQHEKSPDAVIGEPSLAEIRKEGLYVEGTLYPDSAKAKQVYTLAQTLKKSKASRKLGWSVEGKVTKRDPLDESKVLESAITNIAVCISPKNPDSIVDIIKGNYHGWSDDEKPPVQENVDFEIANGGQQFLVDIVRPDGMRITVDKDYNIQVMKSETDKDDEEKALTTSSASGKAVQHEHVDGETKDQMNSNLKNPVVKKSETGDEEEEGLSQDDVIQKIMSSNSVITFEKAEEIFQNLNNLTMSTKTKITDDLLEKSLDKLGFKKALSTKKYQAKTDTDRDNEKDVDVEREEDVDDDEEDDIKGGKNPKAKKTRPDPVKKSEDDDEDEEEEEKPAKKIKKGNDIKNRKEEERDEEDDEPEEYKSVKKSKKPSIKKSFSDEFITVDNSDDIADLKDMIKSLAVVAKAGYDLQKAQANEIAELREKVEEWGEQPQTGGRKSITKGQGDRQFQKSMGGEDALQKAEDGKPIVDVDRAKRQVLNMLDHMTFNKSVDGQANQTFAKAMTLFESSGVMEPGIQKSLETEFGVHLVARNRNQS